MKESKADVLEIFLTQQDEAEIIMKNNKPITALISIQRYQELLEKEENLYYLNLAIKRKENNNDFMSREEFMQEMKIDQQFIDSLPEIELE